MTTNYIGKPSLPTPDSSPIPSERASLCKIPSDITLSQPALPWRKSTAAVVQDMLQDLEGRDKTLKVLQYLLKVLLFHRLVDPKRWSATVSHCSMSRKLLRLGQVLEALREFPENTGSAVQLLIHLNGISNEIADDVYCLYKLGLVSRSVGQRAEDIGTRCWFVGILIDMRATILSIRRMQRKALPDEEQKLFLAKVTLAKLWMDGIFCACDIWTPSYSTGLQAWTGFMSGSLSAYKLWQKFAK